MWGGVQTRITPLLLFERCKKFGGRILKNMSHGSYIILVYVPLNKRIVHWHKKDEWVGDYFPCAPVFSQNIQTFFFFFAYLRNTIL
jgi:hypothetical protein